MVQSAGHAKIQREIRKYYLKKIGVEFFGGVFMGSSIFVETRARFIKRKVKGVMFLKCRDLTKARG